MNKADKFEATWSKKQQDIRDLYYIWKIFIQTQIIIDHDLILERRQGIWSSESLEVY